MKYKIPMPILKAVPIQTRGFPWYKRTWKWLTSLREWEVMEEYELYIPELNTTFICPKGFIFNGASVPKIFRSLLSPTGILFIGAIFHDFAHEYGGYICTNKTYSNNPKFKKCTFNQADRMFREMCVFINDMKIPNYISWVAVKFGYLRWLKSRKLNKKFWEDFPKYINIAREKLKF
jgi:hypothetical protein